MSLDILESGEPDRTPRSREFRSDFTATERDTPQGHGPLKVNGLGAVAGHDEPAELADASPMRRATEWASHASREELKAHAVAIWRAMAPADRMAFRHFLGLEAVREVMRHQEEVELPKSMRGAAA